MDNPGLYKLHTMWMPEPTSACGLPDDLDFTFAVVEVGPDARQLQDLASTIVPPIGSIGFGGTEGDYDVCNATQCVFHLRYSDFSTLTGEMRFVLHDTELVDGTGSVHVPSADLTTSCDQAYAVDGRRLMRL